MICMATLYKSCVPAESDKKWGGGRAIKGGGAGESLAPASPVLQALNFEVSHRSSDDWAATGGNGSERHG